jgi:phage tail protein X
MSMIVRGTGPAPQLLPEIARLKRLLADMEAIAAGKHPRREILDDAPLLNCWTLTLQTEPCLTGVVEGHPEIADLRPVVTSGLWVLAPDLGYARTLSRFYALGWPAE